MTASGISRQDGILETGAGRDNNEGASLLHGSLSELDLTIAKNDTAEPYLHAAKTELKWMGTSSTLTVLTLFLEFSFYAVNVLSVGHLGAIELGAMALAVTYHVILAFSPILGLLAAMDTYCSTTFTASHNKTLVGFHFQRGLIAVCAHCILVTPLLWYSERVLLLLHVEPEIAQLSGLYLRIHILTMFPFSLFEATKRYLQAQGIMRAATIVTMVIAPLHWAGSFVFVRSSRFGIGFVGAPILNAVSTWLLLLGILLYACNSRATETWGGWDPSAFRNMQAYYRLAIPAVFKESTVWTTFELLTLASSYFGANQLAGNAVMLNTVQVMCQFSSGLGYSITPRVGNLIGAAKPRQARIAADMSILASMCIGATGTLFLLFFGDWWTSVYTDDPNVAHETARLIPIACILLMNDGLDAVLSSILRGLGRQKASANIYILGFYICAIPAAIFFGFVKGMETCGLWVGVCIGVFVVSLLQLAYIYLWTDWKIEVHRCILRLKGSTVEHSENDHLE